ncbi:DinB family protein [Halobacillus shinanisalinarum]|uniref:DinB family protein n=1 Tax=Halobacillus shinanisalinarum TaxID=2932258 RepID=A0ABY4H3V2_9BACI|nr:DinB family protein [Halobacillus shinanisalinarum]UOQ94799.1 DinB family protein [Halobacillus shinanisalinarum]
MAFDLKGESNMESVVGILYSTVKENFQRLKSVTEEMEQEELDYHGTDGKFNSAGQLIRHLAYVDLNWVYRIKDEPLPGVLEEKYGPALNENDQLPMVKGVSLQELLSDYEKVYEMFRSECTYLTDNDLDKVVTFGNENEKQATIRWGIWHISDHNRYHQAHINQLRKWYKGEH